MLISQLIIGPRVGDGAYGQVFHAQWEGRKVAIKKFFLGQNEVGQAEVIQREIQILKLLVDRHIIQFYGTTYHDGRLVLIMDYAAGGSLQQAIDAGCMADWPTKRRIAQEVVRGLTYIHYKNVLHRDLKSMNVLLTSQMEVKLCDFGMAIIKTRSASRSTSSAKGTLRWMAPELFTARPIYSTKSDVYALGMVMWELASDCTVPFQQQMDNYTVMGLVKNGEREVIPDDTPLDYRQWIERCWEQDPDVRPEAKDMVTEDDRLDQDDRTRGNMATLSLTADVVQLSLAALPENAKMSNGIAGNPVDDTDTLLARANAGDVEAQVALAARYEGGIGADQDDSEALKWYYRAAPQGSTEAQYKVGAFFTAGRELHHRFVLDA
ncbi:hypothetical protein BGZ73_007303 [Actinomortierella ambigua]|nr:hypothetical protein BGZ73_007303 [Actinomortierella ambigua]